MLVVYIGNSSSVVLQKLDLRTELIVVCMRAGLKKSGGVDEKRMWWSIKSSNNNNNTIEIK